MQIIVPNERRKRRRTPRQVLVKKAGIASGKALEKANMKKGSRLYLFPKFQDRNSQVLQDMGFEDDYTSQLSFW